MSVFCRKSIAPDDFHHYNGHFCSSRNVLCFLSFSIKFATAVDDIPLRQTPPIHDKQLSVADDAFQLAISDTSFRGALQRNATR